MLYKDYFALLTFVSLFSIFAGLLILFGLAFLINKRLDNIATKTRKESNRSQERLFWRIAKYFIQGVIFITAGFFFVSLSGFTPIPIILLWVLFFIVWSLMFLHKFRSISLPTNQFIQLQNIFDEEDDFAIDDDINLTTIPRKNHSIRERFQHYIFTCKLAIRNKKIAFGVGLLIILVATGAFLFLSSCVCIVIHPFEMSTGFSRRFYEQPCEPNKICNTYFTMGTNPNDLIVNFQTFDQPSEAYVLFDFVSLLDSDLDWASKAERANANHAKMTTSEELERFVCWADLALAYNTTYYVVAVYVKGSEIILSKEYKIRTLPETGPFSFISGGDMSMDSYGHKISEIAASRDPYFAMVGGDITYDNGYPSCYPRWDEWFKSWEKLMVTKDGFSIPIIASIGNHEAGGFLSGPGDDPYFSAYFPQQTNIPLTSLHSRLTYAIHKLRSDVVVVVLDSDVVSRIDGEQAVWLDSQLKQVENYSLKMALYHGNIYPAVPQSSSISKRGKEFWVPIFDKYNLTMAFENHCHAYKRTYPLRNDAVSDDGVVYLGDGAWGVDPRQPKADSFGLEVVHKIQFVFDVHVDWEGYTCSVDAVNMDGEVFDHWRKF